MDVLDNLSFMLKEESVQTVHSHAGMNISSGKGSVTPGR
jgi:hypothetical protein